MGCPLDIVPNGTQYVGEYTGLDDANDLPVATNDVVESNENKKSGVRIVGCDNCVGEFL